MSYHPNEVLRRARTARGLLVLAFVALLGAFFRTQVLQNALYRLQSENNRLREVPLPGARGTILDRKGQIIAENLPGYSVSILSPNEDSLRSTLTTLSRIVPIDSVQQQLVVARYRRLPQLPAVIFNDASFQVVSILEERRVELPGLIIQSSPKRYYPDAEAMAALIGYTGEISEKELALPTYAGYSPGQQVGKTGLEKQYEEQLRGREGRRFVEVDARNRVVRDNGVRPEEPAEAPPPLQTNIDLDLQKFVHSVFGDSMRGAAVALEPKTGAVLALYSAPTYDINRFIGGVSSKYFSSLRDDPHKPLLNRALQGAWAPASTFKLATAVIGLQMGLVSIDTRMPQPCTGSFFYGRVFKCHDHRGHGDITLAQAIAKSCDVYFYQLGLKIGLAKLLAGGITLGFNERTGIDLPSETRSQWPQALDYFNKKYGPRGWNQSVVLSMSIGQADNAQTPLNMAKFYTALATDGATAQPQIVAHEPVRTQILNIKPDQLRDLQLALGDVLTSGTGASARIQGLTIAGKTGTSQRPPHPDDAWFVGYAPVDDPKIVVAVIIEEGLHGPVAAKVATKIMESYLKKGLTFTGPTND